MGYKLAGSYETELGMDYNLTWKGLSPFGNPIRNAIFRVEMRENNVLRFKVGFNVTQMCNVLFKRNCLKMHGTKYMITYL